MIAQIEKRPCSIVKQLVLSKYSPNPVPRSTGRGRLRTTTVF